MSSQTGPCHPRSGDSYHVMIKPCGAQCNLNCSYCYYLDKKALLNQPNGSRMSYALLEEHTRQYLAAHSNRDVVFSWQGGEPMLMGLDFFRHAVALQQRYKRPGQNVGNDLQTNGTLIVHLARISLAVRLGSKDRGATKRRSMSRRAISLGVDSTITKIPVQMIKQITAAFTHGFMASLKLQNTPLH